MGAVRLLLERGAKVASTNAHKRMTPLMFAAMRGHVAIVEELLAAASAAQLDTSAFIGAKDERGKTAAHYARLRRHEAVVELLQARERSEAQ